MPRAVLIAAITMDHSSVVISLYDRLTSPRIQSTLKLNEVIIHVTCSSDHALIASKSKCYVIGKGSYGQLGLGPEKLEALSFEPLPNIPIDEYPISIAVSAYHSCVVTAPYGHLYTFGNGAYYRLGNGSTEISQYYPTKVEELVGVGELNEQCIPGGICMVACGTWHTIAVAKGSNDIYGWGWNKFGQIGTDEDVLTLADHEERMITVPTRIPLFDELEDSSSCPIQINDVKCGPRFSAFVLNDTRLFIL
jgi:alpha-tubulin suppressor-like RCC1 family protein